MMPAKPQPDGNPGRPGNVQRVRRAHVEWVAERLSGRDWQIIEEVNRVRLLSGNQIERLCFISLEGHSRAVVRGRVLRRLMRWRVLEALPRRIGGAPRGSAGAVYALGSGGTRLLIDRHLANGQQQRVRRPGAPTDRTVRHILAVSELYVGLMEHAQRQEALVRVFDAEPACWWPDGQSGFLKPDAYVVLARGYIRDHWWIEVDLATESVPTIERKLAAYVSFVDRGHLGPNGLVPRILVVAPSEARCAVLSTVVRRLPAPAAQLCAVCTAGEATAYLVQHLQE